MGSPPTPRDDAGDLLPIMYRTGTLISENAARGVGSLNNALAHPRTLMTDAEIWPLRDSGVRAQVPLPIPEVEETLGRAG